MVVLPPKDEAERQALIASLTDLIPEEKRLTHRVTVCPTRTCWVAKLVRYGKLTPRQRWLRQEARAARGEAQRGAFAFG